MQRVSCVCSYGNENNGKERAYDITNALSSNQDDVTCQIIFVQCFRKVIKAIQQV